MGMTGIDGTTVKRGTAGITRGIGLAALLLSLLLSPAPAAALDGLPLPDAVDEPAPYAPAGGAAVARDPFQPCIEPPTPTVPPPQPPEEVKAVKAVPPLPLALVAVVGNDARRLALLELNGVAYEMTAGEAEGGGLFKLIEVAETSVTVFDSRAGKNRVLELK